MRTAPWRTSASRSRSSVRSNSDMGPGKLGRVVADEVTPDEIGVAAGVLGMGGRQHGTAESSGSGCAQPRDGVLDYHAPLGSEVEQLARSVVAPRVRLARGNVLRGDDLREVWPQSGQLESQLDLGA